MRCRVSGVDTVVVWEMGRYVLSQFLEPNEGDPIASTMTLVCGEAPSGASSRTMGPSPIVQLAETVEPDLMYRHYYYASGLNEHMVKHLGQLVAEVIDLVGPPEVAVDIGSNDGTLLSFYPSGTRRIGFDPSDVGVRAGTHDVRIPEYFKAELLNGVKADIVTSIAMFYDVADPIDFVRQVDSILEDEGIWVVEMHYLRAMLGGNGFDAICLEHLFYYDLQAFMKVVELSDTGMRIAKVEFNDMNGGSFRIYLRTARTRFITEHESVEASLRFERGGAPLSMRLANFVTRCEDNRQVLLGWLREKKGQGRRVFGYGASTKGSTMAQYWGLTPDLVEGIADRNVQKIGKVTSGTRIPVVSEEAAREEADYFLVFPYHFMEMFLRREEAWLNKGGKFLVPMPYPREIRL